MSVRIVSVLTYPVMRYASTMITVQRYIINIITLVATISDYYYYHYYYPHGLHDRLVSSRVRQTLITHGNPVKDEHLF